MLLASVACASGCAVMPLGSGTESDPYVVTINFASASSCTINSVTEDATPCVSGSGFCLGRNQWMRWESNPTGIKYNVYFDPIKGQPLNSDGQGRLKRKIDTDAPFARYKYSILRDGCDKDTDAYDPHIRVDH
jgi:hypothetical protein